MKGERSPVEEWSSRDGQLAVALTQLEAALCSGCGQPQWLGHDEDTDWNPPESARCWSCTHLTEAQEAFSKSGGEAGVPAAHAVKWWITRHHPPPQTPEQQ